MVRAMMEPLYTTEDDVLCVPVEATCTQMVAMKIVMGRYAGFPDAPEQCDGIYNDCLDEDYAADSAPKMSWTMMEITFVECTYAASSWLGSEDIVGGGDCNDDVGDNTVSPAVPSGLNVYPGAEELCDHRFNNCDPLNPENTETLGIYNGVVSDCFCLAADCQIDADGDGISDCVDHAGSQCTQRIWTLMVTLIPARPPMAP